MAEYIVRADETRKTTDYPGDTLSWLLGLPAREEVIRCRDCRFATEVTFSRLLWCEHNHNRDGEMIAVEPSDFCSWAERKEES